MSEIVTGIRLKADASGLVGETRRARDELGRFVASTNSAGVQSRNTAGGINTLSAANGTLVSSIRSTISPMNLLSRGLGALIALFGIQNIIRFSDEIKRLDNQLKLVTVTEKARNQVFQELIQLSNQTYSKVSSTVELYARMTRATKDLNVTQSQLLAVTKAINQSYVISGSSTDEAANSTRQLAQALASGVLRGDEFNSMAEQAPRLMEALSTSLGVTTGDLRKLAEEGQLTSAKLISALISQSAAIDSEFNKMAPTAGQALTVVGNNFRILISQVDAASSNFGGLTNVIFSIADALDALSARIESGEVAAYLQAYGSAWSAWGDNVFQAIEIANYAVAQHPLQVLAARALIEESLNFLGDAFKYYPQNVLAMTKAVGVELANLDRLARLHTIKFGLTIQNELKGLVAKATAYGKELADVLNPFDGDTFDLDGELSQISAFYDAQKSETQSLYDMKIKGAWEARDAVLQSIFDERQASISSMDAQLIAAKALATARMQKPAANDEQFTAPAPFEAPALSDSVTNANYEKLRESFLSQEELLRSHAQREMSIIAQAMQDKQITEQQGLDLIYAARQKHLNQVQALETQRANLIFSSATQTFDGLAGLAKNYAGEQSKAYKVLFAISKGFAISQGIMNLSTAISNAAALPWPANIPAMAQAAATGTSLIANIKGASLQGQAHGGLDKNAREGTWWLRNDEMVLNPRQRQNFESLVAANDSPTAAGRNGSRVLTYAPKINIDATNATPGMEKRIADAVAASQREIWAEIREDFAGNGELSQTFRGAA